MADFLVILGDDESSRRLRRAGPRIAARLGAGSPAASVDTPHVAAWTWRRLDGSGGALAEEDGQWLLVSGSCFDSAEGLAPDDARGLLARIRDEGLETVAKDLDGQFVLVHGDREQPDRVRVVTDPIGTHFAHVYRSGRGAVAIAASSLWLASLEDETPRLDSVGCQEFLGTGVIYGDRTLFRDVRRLPPARVLTVKAKDDRLDEVTTWQPEQLAFGSLQGGAAVEAFGAGMRAALARIAKHADRPVCDLTGGWDSRLLLAFLRDAGIHVETTVTGDANDADVRVSTSIAQQLGIQHHVVATPAPPDLAALDDARNLSDGEVDVVDQARILSVQRSLLPRFGASWNGSFGEVARGYWWEVLQPSPLQTAARLDAAAVARARYTGGREQLDFWPAKDRLSLPAHFTGLIESIDEQLRAEIPLGCRMDHIYLRMRMRCWQGRIASGTDRLRACLSPIMFRCVLEPLLAVLPRERLGNRFARQAMHAFAPDLARLPLEHGGPAMPLTPASAWRFAPQVLDFAKRARRKLMSGSAWTPPRFGKDARLALWRDARFEVRFAPAELRLGRLLDLDTLGPLWTGSRSEDFGDDQLFGRLLAIELALRGQELARKPA